jgi:hypothetical protein
MPEGFMPIAVAAIIGGVIGRPLGALSSMLFGNLPASSAKGEPGDVVRLLMACGGAGGMAGPLVQTYQLPSEEPLYTVIGGSMIAGIVLGAWMGRVIARFLPESAFTKAVKTLNAIQMACVAVVLCAVILTWARKQG